jgi:hypothetical protein
MSARKIVRFIGKTIGYTVMIAFALAILNMGYTLRKNRLYIQSLDPVARAAYFDHRIRVEFSYLPLNTILFHTNGTVLVVANINGTNEITVGFPFQGSIKYGKVDSARLKEKLESRRNPGGEFLRSRPMEDQNTDSVRSYSVSAYDFIRQLTNTNFIGSLEIEGKPMSGR